MDGEFSRGDDDDDVDQTWQASELVTRQRWWLQIFQAPLCAAQWFIIERRQSFPLLTIARNIYLKKTQSHKKYFLTHFARSLMHCQGRKNRARFLQFGSHFSLLVAKTFAEKELLETPEVFEAPSSEEENTTRREESKELFPAAERGKILRTPMVDEQPGQWWGRKAEWGVNEEWAPASRMGDGPGKKQWNGA